MTIGNLLNTQVLPFSSINKSYLPENAELKAIYDEGFKKFVYVYD